MIVLSASYQQSERVRASGNGCFFSTSTLRLQSQKKQKTELNEFIYLTYESRYLIDLFSLSITIRATMATILNATHSFPTCALKFRTRI